MRKGKPNMAVVFLLLICMLLLGCVVALLYYTMQGGENGIIYKILMYGGIGLAAVVLLTLFAYLAASRKNVKTSRRREAPAHRERDDEASDEEERRPSKKAIKESRKEKRAEKRQEMRSKPREETERRAERRPERAVAPERKEPEVMPDAEVRLDEPTKYNGSTASYIPSQSAAQASAGRVQSIEEKFEQIGKMGKAQFVVYMAKLFGLKGYKVNLTPVANNHGVDMTVEKMGVTIAVGCVLSNKLLGEADVRRVEEGKHFYGTERAMVVTNQYFDRAASSYGKTQDTSLVDRNILAEDFMR